MNMDHQIGMWGHDLEYRGAEAVLVVESRSAHDVIAPVEIQTGDSRIRP